MSLGVCLSNGQPALPPDVQYEIFDSIHEERQLLKACTLVCKDWEQRLTPELFNTFVIRPERGRALLTPESFVLELSRAPKRIAESYTRLDVVGLSPFPINCLLSILASLPNVHTLHLSKTRIRLADHRDDPTHRKLSLRKLVVAGNNDNDLFRLLGHFDRVDNLQLVSHSLPPLLFDSSNTVQRLASFQRLMAVYVHPSLLERMILQPQFSERLVELSLVRCVFKWEELAILARILDAPSVKRTLQTFELSPLFGRRRMSSDQHRATMELFADALASCTESLRTVCLFLHCAFPARGISDCAPLSDTFEFYCMLLQRIAQAKLPVAVDLKVTAHPDTDPNDLDTFMKTLDWASLGRAASGLVLASHGRTPPLSLYLARLPQDPDVTLADVHLRIKEWNWRRYLPALSDPADRKLSAVNERLWYVLLSPTFPHCPS